MEDPAAEPLLPLDPRVRRLWWTTAALGAIPVVIAAVLIDAFTGVPLPAGLLPSVVTVAAVAIAWGLPVLRFNRWRYALRADDLWLRRGVLWTTTSVIPYARLQFVDTKQGPLDRLFGLAQLVVYTAAVGTSGHLPGLSADDAERLREQLTDVEDDDLGI
ncbi:MAG: PH domain-containing protein [Actinomycetota bacterium]|jgi:membrane protein YdbS with pleckstrin-like domain|nr:PH domain-containing protein [Actinomycetota bacterium]